MPVLHKGRSVGQSHKKGLKIGLNSGMIFTIINAFERREGFKRFLNIFTVLS